MKPIQVGQYWAIARNDGTVSIHSNLFDLETNYPLAVVSGDIDSPRIYLGSKLLSDRISIYEARQLASLLETAAAIAADWEEWQLRANPLNISSPPDWNEYDAYLISGGSLEYEQWKEGDRPLEHGNPEENPSGEK